jgi:uncharacterized protein (TIGR01370 family)
VTPVRAVVVLGTIAIITMVAVLSVQALKDSDVTDAGDGRDVKAAGATGLDRVACWAPAFGSVDPGTLTGYDLLVVDGIADRDGHRGVTREDIDRWHHERTIVIAYLSVGTVEDWRHYAGAVDPAWTLGGMEGWDGERYVDAGQPGWRRLMLTEAQALADAGFDGLYLDNLDVVDDHPETTDGMVGLVTELRAQVPDLLLIGQNGITIADRIPIDAISHEDVWWRYDEGYRASTAAETQELLGRLTELHDGGLPVFTLDYTPTSDGAAVEVVRRSLQAGFHPAVSVLDLDRPPHTTPCTTVD